MTWPTAGEAGGEGSCRVAGPAGREEGPCLKGQERTEKGGGGEEEGGMDTRWLRHVFVVADTRRSLMSEGWLCLCYSRMRASVGVTYQEGSRAGGAVPWARPDRGACREDHEGASCRGGRGEGSLQEERREEGGRVRGGGGDWWYCRG